MFSETSADVLLGGFVAALFWAALRRRRNIMAIPEKQRIVSPPRTPPTIVPTLLGWDWETPEGKDDASEEDVTDVVARYTGVVVGGGVVEGEIEDFDVVVEEVDEGVFGEEELVLVAGLDSVVGSANIWSVAAVAPHAIYVYVWSGPAVRRRLEQ